MSELREVVVDLLERRGAAVEAIGSHELAVLAPAEILKTMGWPELARLAFGPERSPEAIAIGLEGDWLERFAALLGDEGRWSEREVRLDNGARAPGDPLQVLDRTLDLPNAVWRFHGMTATWTRCLILTFRYTAMSDDKREGLIWLGFNTGTGAIINDLLPQLRPAVAQMSDWHAPNRERCAQPGRDGMRRLPSPGYAPWPIDRCATRSSHSFAPCGGGSGATAIVCTPFTTNCIARPTGGWRRCPMRRAKGWRPTVSARRCASRRSSVSIGLSSMTCGATTPCASPSNGSRRWNFMCRCTVSTC